MQRELAHPCWTRWKERRPPKSFPVLVPTHKRIQRSCRSSLAREELGSLGYLIHPRSSISIAISVLTPNVRHQAAPLGARLHAIVGPQPLSEHTHSTYRMTLSARTRTDSG